MHLPCKEQDKLNLTINLLLKGVMTMQLKEETYKNFMITELPNGRFILSYGCEKYTNIKGEEKTRPFRVGLFSTKELARKKANRLLRIKYEW